MDLRVRSAANAIRSNLIYNREEGTVGDNKKKLATV